MPAQYTRRQFCSGLGAATLLRGASLRPQLACQTYIWLQVFREQKRDLASGIPEMTAGIRSAGFKQVELMSQFLDPEVEVLTLEALYRYGLSAPILYCGGPMHELAAAQKTIEQLLNLALTARRAGAQLVNFNPGPKKGRVPKTDAELAVQAEAVKQLARELGNQGLELILHHHDVEMQHGAREWHYLLEHTECRLCLDLMWAVRGGQDPVGLLRAAGARLASLHVRNTRQGVSAQAFEDGDIDYRQVARYLKQIAFQGWIVVELFYEPATRRTRPLPENLRRSRRYARQVFGV